MNKNIDKFINIDDYEIEGKSKYAISPYFNIIKKIKTDDLYVAKIYLDDNKYFRNELNIYSKLSHPSIVKFIGYSLFNFEGKDKPKLILEYCKNGSLDRLIELERTGKVNNLWTSTIKLINIYGIASAMKYLHSLNIIHGDIKPSNILLDDFLFPKLCDFSNSKSNEGKKDFLCLTREYTAPEVLENNDITKSSDIYSFGMTVYDILAGEKLYKSLNYAQIISKVSVKHDRQHLNESFPEEYKRLIEMCLDLDPNKRPSFDEIVDDLKNNKKYITDDIDENYFKEYIEKIDNELKGLNMSQKQKEIFSEDKKESIHNEYQSIIKNYDIETEKILKKKLKELKIQTIDLSQFEEPKYISKGSYGYVFSIVNSKTKEKYVIKKLKNYDKEEFIHEIEILSSTKHPLILKLIGCSLQGFYDEPCLIMVVEFISNGSLEYILYNERRGNNINEWNETTKLINIYGIASAMENLHSLNICHCDLKPDNILEDEYIFPKICDFGLSLKSTQQRQNIESIRGTIQYCSPEAIKSEEITTKSDVYSFGLLLYEMKCKKIPFENKTLQNIIFLTSNNRRPFIDESVPDVYKNLIISCWDADPTKRPSFTEIVFQLRNNPEFISKEIDENLYHIFIEILDDKMSGKDTIIKLKQNFLTYNLYSLYEEYKKAQYNKNEKETSSENNSDEIYSIDIFDDIEKIKQMTEEENGEIIEFQNKETKEMYSARIPSFTRIEEEDIPNISKESKSIMGISHPSIQKMLGLRIFEHNHQQIPMIFNEFYPYKTLFEIIEETRQNKINNKWNGTTKLINIYGIACALLFLNSHHIYHPTPNPKNILVDLNYYPKMSEIGSFNHQRFTIHHPKK